MKKTALLICAALVMAAALPSCKNGSKAPLSFEEQVTAFNEGYQAIIADTTATEDQIMESLSKYFEDGYAAHHDDSLGLEIFTALISNFWDDERVLAEYDKASDLVKADQLVDTKVQSIIKGAETAPGKPYKQIVGVDALTGAADSLSAHMTSGKPVLVDFWASWCGPCRRCISTELIPAYAEGKIDIVGIAVWEQGIEDTQKAISELGLTWPVIYCGGREDSPSITYGVMAIPTLVLIGGDGNILYKGHSFEEAIALI